MKKKPFKTDNIIDLNFAYYVKYLLNKAPIIIFVTLIGAGIGIYLAKKSTVASYQTTAKLIRYDKKVTGKDVPYQFQDFNYNTALQTIRTRKNLAEVINVLGLDTSVEKLYSSYDIKRAKRSDIIEILYTGPTREDSVKGANTLADIFLKNFYNVQNAATKDVLSYYDKQKTILSSELDNLLKKQETFNKENKILSLKIQKEFKYQQLNVIALNIIDTKVQLNEYSTKIKEINKKLKIISKDIQLSYSVTSADLKAIANKEKELAELKQKYTDFNPKIKVFKNEINRMKQKYEQNKLNKPIPDAITYGENPIYTTLNTELTQSRIGIKSSSNRIEELEMQKITIENEIKEFNILEKKYSRIENELNEKKSMLELVTNRQNELRIALESSKEDFKFLERAKPPKYPTANYKKAIVIGVTFFTFISMVFLFVLRLFLDSRVKVHFDIENRFNIKLIGEFFLHSNKESKSVSSLNFISNLTKVLKEKKFLLVSSDVKGTCKSVVINDLNYFCFKTEQKVLYIETIDELSDEISHAIIDFKDINNCDFSNVNHINEFVDKSYIINNDINNFYMAKVNISKLFSRKIRDSKYDLVIFEIPSFEDNPNMFKIFAPLSDLTLLIFKANWSLRNKINPLVNQLIELDIKNVKGVLNGINKKHL